MNPWKVVAAAAVSAALALLAILLLAVTGDSGGSQVDRLHSVVSGTPVRCDGTTGTYMLRDLLGSVVAVVSISKDRNCSA